MTGYGFPEDTSDPEVVLLRRVCRPFSASFVMWGCEKSRGVRQRAGKVKPLFDAPELSYRRVILTLPF